MPLSPSSIIWFWYKLGIGDHICCVDRVAYYFTAQHTFEKLGEKQAYHATHYFCVHGSAALDGFWLKCKELEISTVLYVANLFCLLAYLGLMLADSKHQKWDELLRCLLHCLYVNIFLPSSNLFWWHNSVFRMSVFGQRAFPAQSMVVR